MTKVLIGLVIGLAIAAVAGAGGGVYYYTQTQQLDTKVATLQQTVEASETKIAEVENRMIKFADAERGVNIDYPASWTLSSNLTFNSQGYLSGTEWTVTLKKGDSTLQFNRIYDVGSGGGANFDQYEYVEVYTLSDGDRLIRVPLTGESLKWRLSSVADPSVESAWVYFVVWSGECLAPGLPVSTVPSTACGSTSSVAIFGKEGATANGGSSAVFYGDEANIAEADQIVVSALTIK